MSGVRIRAVEAEILSRVPMVCAAGQGLALVREQMVATGESMAESITLKLMTESEWTIEAANGLALRTLEDLVKLVTEMVRSFNGTTETEAYLLTAACRAFARRLRELGAGASKGGTA